MKNTFEVRARLKVREGQLDAFRRHAAEMMLEHALNVREARGALFAESAYDHRMAFCGEPSPRLLELVKRIGVDALWYSQFQALDEPAGLLTK